jgi:hypothetical protein
MTEFITDAALSDGPPLPEMREGLLLADDLTTLFADISSCTTVLDVLEKGGAQRYAEAGRVTLDAARERLVSGAVRAVQVRYRYDGFEWSDTVMSLPTGFRLVRCQHPVD